jgi:hypothetical protein
MPGRRAGTPGVSTRASFMKEPLGVGPTHGKREEQRPPLRAPRCGNRCSLAESRACADLFQSPATGPTPTPAWIERRGSTTSGLKGRLFARSSTALFEQLAHLLILHSMPHAILRCLRLLRRSFFRSSPRHLEKRLPKPHLADQCFGRWRRTSTSLASSWDSTTSPKREQRRRKSKHE